MPQIFRGVGVSPGIAVGRVYVLHPQWMPVVAESIPPERVREEIARFAESRTTARQAIAELRDRVGRTIGEPYAGIFDAQLLILDDPRLVEEVPRRIKMGRVSASWALSEVVGEFVRRFETVDDPYIRERAGELADVHRRLQRLLRGRAGVSIPEGPLVVVAHTLGPSDAVALARQGAVGLATDAGGRTSHTAILAQALSVPAVAGLHDISQRVQPGDSIIVDGDAGEVRLLPTDTEAEEAVERDRVTRALEEAKLAAKGRTPRTADGVEVVLRANIEFPTEVEAARRFGARGIGLYRSEFLFLSHSPALPTEEHHYLTYVEIAERMAPEPVTLRTLDLGGEKYFHEVLDRDEANPVLGVRGVRLCLKHPEIFRPQLRGVLRAATRDNIQVLLPMVISPEEIWEVRRLLAEEAEALKGAGIAARADVPLGAMIEVPAAAAAADILARECEFLSIGTNDLIQYALAVDRGNESVAHLYQPLHPGHLRLLRFVVESARDAGVPVSVCGEMAADPAAAELLIGLGLRDLSMQPRALAQMREAIRGLDSEAARIAADRAAAGGAWAAEAAKLQDVEKS